MPCFTDDEEKDKNVKWCCIGSCSFIVCLLLVILLPLSFSRITYYEIGLEQSRISGKVSRDRVYESGFYTLGPDGIFLKYPAYTQNIELPNLSVWSKTSPNDAGTLLSLDISFQYELIPEQLGKLYDKVGTNYEKLVRNLAISAIKNDVVNYSSDDFLTKRRVIEKSLIKMVRKVLNEEAESHLISLQLREVVFPSLYYRRKLDSAVQIQTNNAEEYKRESRIIRGETQEMVKFVENDAELIKDLAVAKADNIVKNSRNNATEIVQSSHNLGLEGMVGVLNLTDRETILSLDYLLQLELNNRTNYLINYDRSALVTTQ